MKRKIRFHPKVPDEVRDYLEHYASISQELAEAFWTELKLSLETLKNMLATYGLDESFLVKNSEFHLAHYGAPTNTTLYFYKGNFYEFLDKDKIEGVVILSINGGGSYSLVYIREENGQLYLPRMRIAEQPRKRTTPNKSYINYSFNGLSHEILSAGSEKLRAEIVLKSEVYGVPYQEALGIYSNSGIIWTAAGGIIKEATINYFIEAEEFEIKAFKDIESRELIGEWKSEGAVQRGDSHTIDLLNSKEVIPKP